VSRDSRVKAKPAREDDRRPDDGGPIAQAQTTSTCARDVKEKQIQHPGAGAVESSRAL
jgi:hypothetical protein